MKLVIEIDEENYEKNKYGRCPVTVMRKAIRNGKLLPKGHGDLIDRDDLLEDSYCIDDWSGNEVNIVDVKTVKMADAIIESDGGGKDEVSD